MENAMKHIHRTRGDRIFDAINVAALCLLLAVILYPLIYVLSCSFSDPLLVVHSKITFLPMQPTLVAYQRVFRNELIMTGYQNTLFYTLLGTVLFPVLAYVFSHDIPTTVCAVIASAIILYTHLDNVRKTRNHADLKVKNYFRDVLFKREK